MAGQSTVEIKEQVKDFSLLQNVQTGSAAHPASYLTEPKFFLGGTAARALFIYLHLAG
jgi:indole-3-glycerol phosphate synthase